jgi:hypothetical protein
LLNIRVGMIYMANGDQDSAEHWDAMYAAPRSMTWHRNREVADYISKRLFGRPGHWLGFILTKFSAAALVDCFQSAVDQANTN